MVTRAPTSPFVRDAQQALAHAQRAFERGRLQEAIGLLEQALTLGAESVAVRTMLGIAYARTYQVDRAVEQLDRAVALDPDAFEPRCALGELYLRLCIPDQARAHLDRALECASNAAERAYIQGLLKEESARERRRIQRPNFRRPFWLLRRREEGDEG
jgi:tetratricopeptide (TPR) repeat protein